MEEEKVIKIGQIEFTNNGNASIKIDDVNYFIYKNNTKNSLNLDKVEVEIIKRGKKLEAVVNNVVERFRTQFVGTIIKRDKTTFLKPDNSKIHVDFYVKGGLEVENNQKVLVEFIKWEKKSPQVNVIKILGDVGDNNAEMNSIMYEYNLPVDFPQAVLDESYLISEVISDNEIKVRRDMRDVVTITIDPVDAKDFDDALSIKKIADDLYEVGVHIADVSYYVKQDSEIDKEAYIRGTSVYLVDRCVPMLPEVLSNGICSLKPNVDRLAFSVIYQIDLDGNIKNEWIGKTVIHSDRRFTYEEAQTIIESGVGEYSDEVLILDKIAKKMRKNRFKSGSIDIGGKEVKFILADDNKKPIDVYFKEQKDSNKLIEEFMLLANKTTAKAIKSKLGFSVNRSHPEPNIDKLVELKNICDKMGYDFDITDISKIKESINKLIKKVKDTPEENFMSALIVRTQSKAYYTTENIGHYGLGFEDYTHFTSGIRRYSDLLTARLLTSTLSNGDYLRKETS